MAALRPMGLLLLALVVFAAHPQPAAAAPGVGQGAFLGLGGAEPLDQGRVSFQNQGGQRPAASMVMPKPSAPALDTVLVIIITVLFHALLMSMVACLYVHHKSTVVVLSVQEEAAEKASLDGGFSHGLFSCCDTPRLSCFTCWCMGVRWADSVRMASSFSFLAAVLVWLGVQLIAMLFSGKADADGIMLWLFVAWLGMTVVGTIFRQRLRRLFGMEAGCGVVFVDCIKWACCGCCAAVQEARQLEEAKEVGHSAVDEAVPLDLTFH